MEDNTRVEDLDNASRSIAGQFESCISTVRAGILVIACSPQPSCPGMPCLVRDIWADGYIFQAVTVYTPLYYIWIEPPLY